LNVAKDFNGAKVKAFDAKLDALTTERQDLKDRLQNLSGIVGGVDISFDPFSDISSEFEGRLGVIGEENSVTTRLRGLMSLSD